MKTIKIVLVLVFIQFVIKINAQVHKEWAAKYTNGYPMPAFVKLDHSGNVYVGACASQSIIVTDYIVIKYNSAGIQQWAKKYNGTGDTMDVLNSMAVDYNTGNVYVTGKSIGNSGDYDIVTIRYNSAGVQKWLKRFDASSDDEGVKVAIDNSGNTYVTGITHSNGLNFDMITIKYDPLGNKLWQKVHNGPDDGDDYSSSIVIDDSANVYIGGYETDPVTSQTNGVVIKYNTDGIRQWTKRYDQLSVYNDMINFLALGAGYLYAGGRIDYNAMYNYDFLILKFDLNGAFQWFSYYDNTGSEIAQGMSVDPSGNSYMTGYSFIPPWLSFVTVKFDASGVKQWARKFSGPGGTTTDNEGNAVTTDNSGNVYSTGQGNSSNFYDYITIKYNSSGVKQWRKRYDFSTLYDAAYDIVVDTLDNVYVTGFGQSNQTSDWNIITIKYSQTISAKPKPEEEENSNIPFKFRLEQNYPNPFNPVTRIDFSIPKQGFVKLVVYDLLGRVIKQIVNENLDAGLHGYDFDASDLSSGVYIYRIEAGDFSDCKKMLLVK
jgi:hypothetical protein